MLNESVIREDHRLDDANARTGEDLARHRWHWTLDESNPDRVPVREYARQVGRARNPIYVMVHAYAAWQVAPAAGAALPGQPVTLSDFAQRERMTAERAEAVEVIAAQTGKTFSAAGHSSKSREVDEVLHMARDRAERRGTDMSDELPGVVEAREKSRQSDAKRKADRQAAHMFRWIAVEGHLGKAHRALVATLNESAGVEFTDEEVEFMSDALAKVRALLGLIDLRIAGDVDVDWDAELAKLNGGAP